MIKIIVWFRAYWRSLLLMIGLCILLAFIITGFTLCIQASIEITEQIEQKGLKSVVNDIWHGKNK